MRIDGIQLREGSSVTNMVIASGSAFPNSPNTGELFYRTDGANKGLYVYEGSNSSWNKHFNANDAALALPNATSPGTYKSVTVSDQGIVTSGTNPNTLAGYGITDAQPLDADLTAIAVLPGSSGFLKKNAPDAWTLDTNTYLTGNQNITLTGGISGSGATNINATVITNANLTGVVTSEGNATSIANGAISNAMLANDSITLGSTNIALGATSTTLAGLDSVTSAQFVGALNGSVGAITPNSGVFTSVSASGKISSTSDSTTPTDGSAYFYKSSPGAVVSGYQVIIETGLAGNRTTKATFDNIGNLGIGTAPSAWSFGGNIQMTSAACLTFNGPSYIGSNFYNNGGWKYTSTAPSTIYSQTAGRHIWSNAVSGTADTFISYVQGMELNASNNLIVTGSITGTSFNSITGLSSTLPAASGTAAIGVSTTAARSDHVHALQTSVSGSAATLATGRTFSLSTDATGTSASFDGSANVTIPMTLATVNSNVGSFGSATQVASITLDAKGRTTSASNVSIAIPTSAVTSGTFADARIATSNVTQHQASLSIAETQITDGTLLARNAGNETISGNWTFSNVVTGVTPSAASHFATKEYVDGLATGLDTKASCRAATTANITLSGTQTIDGVAVIAGNRVLVKDQSTASQNGIYDVAAGAWVRSADADNLPGAEVTAGMYTFISEGTVNADTGWTLSTNDTVVLGTTPLTFTQFTGLGQISAGAGLTKTGSVIDIGTASASRIVINTDNIDLATAGTAGTYKSVTTDAYGRVTAGSNPTTLAGYGITDAVTAVSVVTANGVSGSVTSTTTPAITLTLGAITPSSVTATGQITAGSASGFHLDQIGTRSWDITATGGKLNINSGDASGTISTNTNLSFAGTLSGGMTAGGRMFSANGSVIKTKISSTDAAWASFTMYEAASSALALGAFGAYGTTKDTALYSYIAAQGQDYTNASLKVTPTQVLITGTLRAGDTYYGVTAIERTDPYVNGIKIKTTIEWANNSFFELHIHGYHYRQGTTVDLRICAYAYSIGGAPIHYSATSAGGWAPTITLVNDSGFISIVLGVNKQDGYFLQCSVDLTSQVVPNLTGWTVVDETGTGLSVQYNSDFGYATVNSLGLQVIGGTTLTTTDGLGGLVVSGAAQSSIFNSTVGSYSTWQHNSTSVGDIGTGNQVFSGGTITDLGITARSGGRLVLGANGSSKVILDTAGNFGFGVTPSGWSSSSALEMGNLHAWSKYGYAMNCYYDGAWKYRTTAATSLFQASGNTFSWNTAPSGTAGNAITFTQAMTLDASGNLGLGVTPSAWSSGFKAFEFGAGNALMSGSSGYSQLYLLNNAYYNGSAYIYKNTQAAAMYQHNQGTHTWYTAPSGTAGNAITFTQVMTLGESGNLDVFGRVTADNVDGFFLNQAGVRSWTTTATGGNLNIGAGDGLGSIIFNGDKLTISSTGLKAVSLSDPASTRITNPGGGSYVTGASVTGALKIVLPVGMTSTMIRMTIKVYEYNSAGSFEINCGGYNYPTGNTWANNPFAYIINTPGISRNYNVRFGYTAGGKAVIYIGELNTVWNYPQVFVTDVQLGYGGYGSPFASGWVVGVEPTAFENVTATVSNTQISLASTVAGSALGTAAVGSSLAFARADHVHPAQVNITGNAATATSASTATNLYGPGASWIASSTSGTSYSSAIQVREAGLSGINGGNMAFAPRLAFHWSGTVASSIAMETSGRIAICNNPGTGYENFIANNITGNTFISSVATGTAPFTVASTTNVANLNADLLDGQHGSYYLNLANSTGTASSANRLISVDRRAVVQTPAYFGAGADLSFMQNTTDGLSDGGSYHGVLHLQPYSDATGGGAYEVGFTDNNNMWLRGSSGSLTTWGAWKKIWDSSNLTNLSQLTNGPGYITSSGSISGNAATATTLQTARTINGVSFNGSANITINAVDATARIASSEKGAANGVATLDGSGLIPTGQLPSYVDDVLEYANLASFPGSGATGKIYVALDTNKTYRWSGSAYVYITSGAVDSVAGKTGVVTLVKADVGLGSVDNTADSVKSVSYAATAGSANQIDGVNFINTGSATPTNADTVASNGISYYTAGVPNFTGNATDGALHTQVHTAGTWEHQIAGDYRSGQIALRGKNNGTWQAWRTVWDSVNLTNLSQLSNGPGFITSSGSITGNAASATVLQTARTINGVSFNGSANIKTTEWFHSGRDFPLGTAIYTDIDYSVTAGDSFIIEIKGNAYGAIIPFDMQIQGYIYSNTIINITSVSNGQQIPGIVALNVGGLLTIWFPTMSYWQGFNVRVYRSTSGQNYNAVTSITNTAKPSGTKEVSLMANAVQSWHTGNLTNLSQLSNGPGYATGGGTASGTNTGDNAANTNYANDYRAANFVAGTNYLAPNGSAASLTSFPTFNQNTTGYARMLDSPDGDRLSSTKLPTTSPNKVRFDFVGGGQVGSPGSTYAGLMTYAPWLGTTASTGDASYQLAFASTATNGSGFPVLKFRKGIDSTWNTWYDVLTSATFTAGTNYLAPNGSAAGLTSFPTFNQNTTGNAATATAISGVATIIGYSTSGQPISYTSTGGPQIMGQSAGAAMLSFHRPGAYAVNFGLDTDNVLKVGGWSMGAVSYKIWHEGNDGAGSGLDADLLDGQSSAYYAPISAPSFTSTITVAGVVTTNAGITEKKSALGALNIDLSLSTYFSKTISATSTLTVSNVPASGNVGSFILDLTNGGAYAITWWSGMKWAGGTAPTLTASGRDVLAFFTHDGGTTWNGLVLAKDIK